MEKPFSIAIQQLLASHALDIQELAERTGLSRQAVSRHIHGHNFPHRATRKKYAAAFKMSIDELDDLWRQQNMPVNPAVPGLDEKGRLQQFGMMPVFNGVPAGPPLDYESVGIHDGVADDYIPRMGSGVDDPSAFAVIVVGDSMTPEFCDGDTIVCSPAAPIKDGDVVFVRFDATHENTCTLKRVFEEEDVLRLEPDNRRHRVLRIPKAEVISMGRVVAKWTRYI